MTKAYLQTRLLVCLVLVLLGGTNALFADDHFSLSVGTHGDLIITGPNGDKVGDFNPPVIAQNVAIGTGPSFQISYGRDMNDMMSAIISPDPSHPTDLHFSVLNKQVDADHQAVVTLTFTSSFSKVQVDPGFVGVVTVDSKQVHHHTSRRTAEAEPNTPVIPVSTASADAPADSSDSATTASTTATTDVTSVPNHSASPAARPNPAIGPADLPPSANANNNIGPSLSGSDNGTVVQPVAGTDNGQPSSTMNKRRLFWAEPVTGPGSNTPSVAPNEMKLVAVHGTVTVTTPDGHTEKGVNGLLVPTGSTVTAEAASSAAVFMGGVDSARVMPGSSIKVTENMEGTVRHTQIDLQEGSVFSRVGKRAGESQKYEVATTDGVAAARGTEFLDIKIGHHHLVFVNKGVVDMFVDGHLIGTVLGGSGKIGMNQMGEPRYTPTELNGYLNGILKQLQPFNVTTIQALFDFENGQATDQEVALIKDELYGANPADNGGFSPQEQVFLANVAAGLHDLLQSADPAFSSNFQSTADEATSSSELAQPR